MPTLLLLLVAGFSPQTDFDAALTRLRQGRTYSADAAGGRLLRTRIGVDGQTIDDDRQMLFAAELVIEI